MFLTAVLMASLSLQTAAAPAPAETKKASLTLSMTQNGDGISGVEWSAYQVAEMPQDGKLKLKEAFASSGLNVESLDGSTAEEMQKNAAATAAYVGKNSITADKTAETDKAGIAKMQDMEKGLYLIRQTGSNNTKMTVQTTPFFAVLPMMEKVNGEYIWKYDVSARPKYQVTEIPESEPSTEPSESEPSTESPENEPSTEAPENEPSTESPENEPSTEAPENEPSTESPESEPSTEAPENEPSTESPENEPSTEAPNNSGGGGSHGGGGNHGGGSSSGGNTVTILDPQTPLASFVQPLTPENDPELVEIEDEPVPLAALPFVPKMGDMGTGAYLAGIFISFLFGGGALAMRRKYTGEETQKNEQ